MGEKSIRIRVPGTSANCGPGFDTLGVACTIYNELELTLLHEPRLAIEIKGDGASKIPQDERNIVWRSVRYLLEKAGAQGEYPGAVIRMENRVPLSRGLGSSATAIVSGLKAANVLLDNRFTRRELLQFATEIEGHPDNVAPALFGGFTVSILQHGRTETISFVPKLRMKFVVAIPDFYLSTKVARQALPEQVSLQDAVFNVGRASMLVAALLKGNDKVLRDAFDDALHQPYRMSLVPGMKEVFQAAKKAGAVGAALSGAGPCLFAFTLERDRCTQDVGEAMTKAFQAHDVQAKAITLGLDLKGAHVMNHAESLKK